MPSALPDNFKTSLLVPGEKKCIYSAFYPYEGIVSAFRQRGPEYRCDLPLCVLPKFSDAQVISHAIYWRLVTDTSIESNTKAQVPFSFDVGSD